MHVLPKMLLKLRYFWSKGDLKWISLMLWAKADARSMGPSLEEEYTNDFPKVTRPDSKLNPNPRKHGSGLL